MGVEFRASAGPIPGSRRTGSPATTAAASLPSTQKPRGLSRPAAILAASRLRARPTETVMPRSRSTARANPVRTAAGGDPCSVAVPRRSSTASSIDSGCTSGVSACIFARISRLTALYLRKSGRITTASGQARNALNIGIALRTPRSRAT